MSGKKDSGDVISASLQFVKEFNSVRFWYLFVKDHIIAPTWGISGKKGSGGIKERNVNSLSK